MRWWLKLQPSYGPEKGLTNEQLNTLEDGVESLESELNSPFPMLSRVHLKDAQDADRAGRKKNYECSLETTETMKSCKFLEVESVECLVSEKTNDFRYDPDSPWVGSGKAELWWRTTDKDELASLVAKKSLDFIENCDLPPTQKMHVRRYSHERSSSFDGDEVSSAWKSRTGPASSPIIEAGISPDSARKHGRHMSSVGEGMMQCASNTSFSTTQKDFIEQVMESDPTKAQLLEALHHSQTRAREAEKEAKQAYAEKDHVTELIFKQASQIYAYKQWLKMLQLDSLYPQIKSNEQPPAVVPWKPNKIRKSRKSLQKTGKGRQGKRSQPRPSIEEYAVAFALGMSLGAGLLLGWTVGWMLPF